MITFWEKNDKTNEFVLKAINYRKSLGNMGKGEASRR